MHKAVFNKPLNASEIKYQALLLQCMTACKNQLIGPKIIFIKRHCQFKKVGGIFKNSVQK